MKKISFLLVLLMMLSVTVVGAEFSAGEIINGYFTEEILDNQEGNPNQWYIWQAGTYGISGAALAEYGVTEENEFKMVIADIGTDFWHLQFNQHAALDAGEYEFTFKARAEESRDLSLGVLDEATEDRLAEGFFDLEDQMKEFSLDIEIDEDYPEVKFTFEAGQISDNSIPTSIYIDQVQLIKK